MKTYRVLLHVGGITLPTLLSLIADHADIRLVQVSDTADAEPLPPSPPPAVPRVAATSQASSRFVGGKQDKGISGKTLITLVLQSGPADLAELRRALVHRDFAAASAAGYVSRMLRDGLIRRAAHGRYVLNNSETTKGNSRGG
jgi:hypothetical protein